MLQNKKHKNIKIQVKGFVFFYITLSSTMIFMLCFLWMLSFLYLYFKIFSKMPKRPIKNNYAYLYALCTTKICDFLILQISEAVIQ